AVVERDHAERPHVAVLDLEHEQPALGAVQEVEVLGLEAQRVDRRIAGRDDAVELAAEHADRIGAALALVERDPALGTFVDELSDEAIEVALEADDPAQQHATELLRFTVAVVPDTLPRPLRERVRDDRSSGHEQDNTRSGAWYRGVDNCR